MCKLVTLPGNGICMWSPSVSVCLISWILNLPSSCALQVEFNVSWIRATTTNTSLVLMLKWGSPSASDPRAKNTGQRATKGTVLTSHSLSPWCDCRRLGSTWASWRWQDINVGNPLWRRALLGLRTSPHIASYSILLEVRGQPDDTCGQGGGAIGVFLKKKKTSGKRWWNNSLFRKV